METAGWIEALRTEGRRMAAAAARPPPGAPVPSCPGWLVRDLLQHTGRVHRWARLIVAEARPRPPRFEEALPEGPPSDERLIDWFREGCERLADALEGASPDLRCWTFRDEPPARAFWARRQAHETSIHRVDAELAAGMDPRGFAPAFAADGIDELLTMFILRPGRNPSAPRVMTLAVEASDAGRGWTVAFGPDEAAGRRGAEEADCTVSGPASGLYTFLWNRTPTEEIGVEGDPEVLARWASSASF